MYYIVSQSGMREENSEDFKSLGESGRPYDIQWWDGDISHSVGTHTPFANREAY